MKFLTLILACLLGLLSPIETKAQNDWQIPESVPANNGELDWLLYKDRNGEAKLDKKDLILKSNNKSVFAKTVSIIEPSMTFAKIPLNLDGDFYLSATMKPSKVDDKTLFGLVFNAANEADYNAILFDNQFCYFVRVYKLMNLTQIQGLQDRVRYKYQKAPKDMWKIAIERKNGGDYIVTLNGLEVRTISGTLQLPLPCIGACVTNKSEIKVTEVSYGQYSMPADTE